ncbi:2-aminoadipate transaminase [Friedmanniella luteola]|uniref:2-aminoadipate transaminase n=1 Tax=Friedmanniella luteola TaxID=546871 RepID=A0A1H1RZ37_9ACTN|nr:PLP-dependent aminotransferase family protein [Friedmanniella luteola]SDS41021.1 2-aminoadipate transaminase [Friedmanniella luteola]
MTTLQPTPPTTTALPALAARVRAARSSVIRDLLALTERPGVISFAGGLPAPELFDLDGARASFAAVLADDGPRALQYSPTEGDRALRAAVAARCTERGLPTDGADVIITTGSQQGLNLLATALVDPGDVVLVESPSYLAALQCFALAGARLVPVPSGEDGIDVDALADLAARLAPKLLYTVPTFQNPTGRTLDLANRRAVVAVAEQHGFRVLEDDPYAELRYSGEPVLPLAALTEPGRVVSTGSFSKILAPGLRLGWVRTDPSLRAGVVVAKQAADLHTSTVDQAAAAHYLASGRLDAAVARTRAEYRRRRDALLAGLPAALPAGSRWTSPDGGMFVWATLPAGWDTTALLPRALEHDVAYVPGAPFFPTDPEPATLRLSFTTYGPDAIAEGTRRLAAVFAS